MSTDASSAAHAIVATMEQGRGPGVWRLERAAVAARLHELVDAPGLIRQGGLNLCGPAALFRLWLARDPVAVVTYAIRVFEEGRGALGTLDIAASAALRAFPYQDCAQAERCPQADWMLMAALRDGSNRFLRYATPGGWSEPPAAITLPGALRRWLVATGLFASVRDETSLVLRKGLGHLYGLAAGGDRETVALVAQEVFRVPSSPLRRARDAVTALAPNHWIVLRSPVTSRAQGRVLLRFWSWGAEHAVELPGSRLRRCYFGALTAQA